MSALNDVGIIGTAIWPSIPDDGRSLEEILFDITRTVLDNSGLTIEDIEGVLVGSNDQYDGRAIAIMAASGSVGGVDRDILSTPSAGEHAFVMGALRVASGQFSTQLVLAWSSLEADNVPEVQRLAADPYYHRGLPLDELSSHALQAGVLERRDGVRERAEAIAAKGRANGKKAYPALVSPVDETAMRWPLTGSMIAPPANGVIALVLASRDFVSQRRGHVAAWIEGLGWSTEPSFLGDRDLATLPSLAAAIERAGAGGGTFDVAEVAAATPHQELLAVETLGLDPAVPVNPSGGALAINPVFCAGLASIAEVANQVRGVAGIHQIAGARRGIAHAASGFAMQYNTVVVLSGDETGAAV